MNVADVVAALEALAPPSLAPQGDPGGMGLLVGEPAGRVRKLLLCVDLTEAVVAEAGGVGAGMVMAYHPAIYRPITRLTAQAAPGAYAAARAGLAVYSMHTAWDAAVGGANDVLAGRLGLEHCRPLEPAIAAGQCKIVTFVPPDDLSRVADAAFSAGAGRIGNYYDCAFFVHGIGAFCGSGGTHPRIGQPGHHEAAEEMRLEVLAPRSRAAEVCAAIRAAHGYETPALDVYPVEDYPAGAGMGRIGRLARPAGAAAVVERVRRATGLKRLWVARPRGRRAGRKVSTAACCAGAGGELLRPAIEAGAEFYLTGELRHHDALAAVQAGLTVACLGHWNSERLGLPTLAGRLRRLLPKLPVAISKADRDPLEIV